MRSTRTIPMAVAALIGGCGGPITGTVAPKQSGGGVSPGAPATTTATTTPVAPTATTRATEAAPAPATTTPAPASTRPRPQITKRMIPYGGERKRDMAAYSKRHYGERTWRLSDPKVIVIHYTVNDSVDATYNTFAPNVADPELNEKPGTCSHFVIGKGGETVQLVPTSIRCRHTVGLNWTAIGIEHVGRSDAGVLGNRDEMRASLRLTAWLRCRYNIPVENVIGHNESLSSPFHKENVARLRKQTHGDFPRAAAAKYRKRLAKLGCAT